MLMDLIFNYPFYFRANLNIVQELGDRAAQGRACGNLGNTHYLLGNFSQAIIFHQEVRSMAYFNNSMHAVLLSPDKLAGI